jgi:uncharacterized membrane protein YccC
LSKNQIISVDGALFGTKTFVAAVAAYGLAVYFNLPRPYWAMTTAYVIANPLAGSLTSKAFYRLIGTFVGGIAIIALIPNLVGSPVILTLAIALWIGTCLYFSVLDRTPRSYAFVLAGYTVLLTGIPLVDTPGQVFDIAVARVEEITLAIICGAVVHLVFFPRNNGPLLLNSVDSWHNKMVALAVNVFRGSNNPEDTAVGWRNLASESIEMRNLFVQVSYEASRYSDKRKLLKALQHRMSLLIPALSAIEDQLIDLRENSYTGSAEILEILNRIAVLIEKKERFGIRGYRAIRAEADKLSAISTTVNDAESIVAANIFKRVQEFAAIWRDCARLRFDFHRGRISKASEKIISITDTIPIHRDHHNAFRSAFTAALTIIISICLWIITGFPEGMIVAQLSGVLMCLTAHMDDPRVVLRMFLYGNILSAFVAFIYSFAVLPGLNNFIPIMASLGLTLIPMGALAANPAYALIGMGFCINMPNMVNLQYSINLDLPTFMSGCISIILATLLPIAVSGIFKSVGAETSAKSLLKSGWKILARIASFPRANNSRNLLILLDILGTLAPRYSNVSADSKIMSGDLLRDLRIGQNLVQLQKICLDMPEEAQEVFINFFKEMTKYYRSKYQFRDYDQRILLTLLKKCRAVTYDDDDKNRSYQLHIIITALEICIKINIERAARFMPLDHEIEEVGAV